MNIVIALLVAAAVAGLALLQWRKAELSRKAETARARMIESLTDRFRDQEEFLAFARSDEGRLLLGARDVASEIGRRLLLMIQASLLLAAIGTGFLITALTTAPNADINLIREAEEARYWGTMCLALAAGLFAAFLVCQSRARAWGLLPR
jgi:uncharacterized membrane protein YccC